MDDGYGIITTGFNKKTFLNLKDNLETKLKSTDLFGADIDFTDQDPLYQFSVPILELFAELWEVGEQIFYSASPKYAEGNPLSSTGKYIGIARKQATKSLGTARFSGTAGTSISTGFQVSTSSSIYFVTTESKLISSSGYIDIAIQAVDAGNNGDVPADTITKIITPIIGLNSVTNSSATTGGQDQESDSDFRIRYEESTANGAGSTIDAIKASVLSVTDVSDAIVTENDTNVTVNSIPAKSFLTLVNGGNDTEIAQAIFDKKPAGINAYGTTIVNILDSQGISHPIGFSRPVNVNTWIKVDITTDSNFPTDGSVQIKTCVKSYIDSLGLGEDVTIYKIITSISKLSLSGLLDMQITLSLNGTTYVSTNITIDSDKIAITDITKIGVI